MSADCCGSCRTSALGLTQVAYATGNTVQDVSTTFKVGSVGVTNPGSCWVKFPQIPALVPPRQYGVVLPPPSGGYMSTVKIDLTQVPSTAYVQNLTDLSPALITFYEDVYPVSPGQSLLPFLPAVFGGPTYSHGGSVTVGANPTDFWTIQSAAGYYINIYRIAINGQQTTGSLLPIQLFKRSTLDTGGSSSLNNGVAHDSQDTSLSQASVQLYTANPTLGLQVGNVPLRLLRALVPAAGNGPAPSLIEWRFGISTNTKPLVLRDTTSCYTLNLAAQAQVGAVYQVEVEFTESRL